MQTSSVVIKKRNNLNFEKYVHMSRYRAVHRETGQHLHMSGEFLTNNVNYSWTGSRSQYERLCAVMGYDQRDYRLESVSDEEKALHN